MLSETTIAREVVGPRVVLVESPAGAALEAGGVASLRFRLRNGGDQRALGSFSFQVFDEPREAAFDLPPGQDVEVVFDVPIADDVEAKRYPGRYGIAVQGLAEISGQVNFTVNGIALDVEPSLDKDAYLDGETARLTVAVTNGRPGLGTDYRVRVHYGGFEETRTLVVSGSATTLFEIPLPQVTGEPAFIGISHPDGRSLYINTLHIRRADALATITLDSQVYAPGANVTITATAASPGTLTLAAPGFSEVDRGHRQRDAQLLPARRTWLAGRSSSRGASPARPEAPRARCRSTSRACACESSRRGSTKAAIRRASRSRRRSR